MITPRITFKSAATRICLVIGLAPSAALSACTSVEKLGKRFQFKVTPITLNLALWKKEIKALGEYAEMVQADYLTVIGFSADGKVAFRQQTIRSNECGPCGQIIVQDLKTDKIEEQFFYEGDVGLRTARDDKIDPGIYQEESLERFKKSQMYQLLSKHKIKVDCDLKVEPFPFDFQGTKIDATLDKMVLRLKKNEQDKIISDLKKNSDKQSGIFSPKIIGFVRSPFEDRILVIVAHQARGWEDTFLSTVTGLMFGAQLTTGFKSR